MTYGLAPRKGAIEVGADADLVLFDPSATWRLEAARLHMATDFSPYEGREMTGRIVTTISRGETIVEDGKPCARAGRGRFVARGNAAGRAVAR